MEGMYKGKVSLKIDFIDIGPRYEFDNYRFTKEELDLTHSLVFIISKTLTMQGKLMDERKDGNMISIKGHIGLLHEEDRKCLILKINASGKNEDIT